jgi:plasmid replication initiation protein
MIPTKTNIEKIRKKEKKITKYKKVSNSFIENAIYKSNLSALKTIYYMSERFDISDFIIPSNIEDKKILTFRMNKKDMLNFTGLTANTIKKTIKTMQQTSITFIDEKNKVIEGMSLIPRYEIIPNKNLIEIDIYAKIAKMIAGVKKNYTNIDIKSLMALRNPHSIRILAMLNRISNYDRNIPKRKRLNLEELNAFFGTKYKSWSAIERAVIKPIQNELNNNSDISFIYESNFQNFGIGRPKFKEVTIDIINNKNR